MNISFLSEHPDKVTEIAQWYYDEWADAMPGATIETLTKNLQKKAQSDGRIPLVFIAHKEGVLQGAVQLRYRENKSHPEYMHWLGGLFVNSKSRRSGVAAALIERSKSHITELGLTELYLQCEPELVSMYQKYGFKKLHKAQHREIETTIMVWGAK